MKDTDNTQTFGSVQIAKEIIAAAKMEESKVQKNDACDAKKKTSFCNSSSSSSDGSSNSSSSSSSISQENQGEDQKQSEQEVPNQAHSDGPASAENQAATSQAVSADPNEEEKKQHQQEDQDNDNQGQQTTDQAQDDQDEEEYEEEIYQPVSQAAFVVEVSPKGRFKRFNTELGRGAYKIVYSGIDYETGTEIAWNVINLNRLPKQDHKRIKSEIDLMKKLEHKNIIHFISAWFNKEKEQVVFITEMISGGNLRKYVKKIKNPRLKVIKGWCKEILQGLVYLHEYKPHPIIHRDLKCDNIFINSHSGEIRIGDLGLSTPMQNSFTTSVLGTPEFMAPELYEECYGTAVDIYAFGMCLLEMLTLERPYKECQNPAQIYNKVVHGIRPKALDRIKDDEVKEFILRCLDRVEKRPSAKDLLESKFLNDIDSEKNNYVVQVSKLESKDQRKGALGHSSDDSSDNIAGGVGLRHRGRHGSTIIEEEEENSGDTNANPNVKNQEHVTIGQVQPAQVQDQNEKPQNPEGNPAIEAESTQDQNDTQVDADASKPSEDSVKREPEIHASPAREMEKQPQENVVKQDSSPFAFSAAQDQYGSIRPQNMPMRKASYDNQSKRDKRKLKQEAKNDESVNFLLNIDEQKNRKLMERSLLHAAGLEAARGGDDDDKYSNNQVVSTENILDELKNQDKLEEEQKLLQLKQQDETANGSKNLLLLSQSNTITSLTVPKPTAIAKVSGVGTAACTQSDSNEPVKPPQNVSGGANSKSMTKSLVPQVAGNPSKMSISTKKNFKEDDHQHLNAQLSQKKPVATGRQSILNPNSSGSHSVSKSTTGANVGQIKKQQTNNSEIARNIQEEQPIPTAVQPPPLKKSGSTFLNAAISMQSTIQSQCNEKPGQLSQSSSHNSSIDKKQKNSTPGQQIHQNSDNILQQHPQISLVNAAAIAAAPNNQGGSFKTQSKPPQPQQSVPQQSTTQEAEFDEQNSSSSENNEDRQDSDSEVDKILLSQAQSNKQLVVPTQTNIDSKAAAAANEFSFQKKTITEKKNSANVQQPAQQPTQALQKPEPATQQVAESKERLLTPKGSQKSQQQPSFGGGQSVTLLPTTSTAQQKQSQPTLPVQPQPQNTTTQQKQGQVESKPQVVNGGQQIRNSLEGNKGGTPSQFSSTATLIQQANSAAQQSFQPGPASQKQPSKKVDSQEAPPFKQELSKVSLTQNQSYPMAAPKKDPATSSVVIKRIEEDSIQLLYKINGKEVTFNFDMRNDTPQGVASEMVKELNLSQSQMEVISKQIQTAIYRKEITSKDQEKQLSYAKTSDATQQQQQPPAPVSTATQKPQTSVPSQAISSRQQQQQPLAPQGNSSQVLPPPPPPSISPTPIPPVASTGGIQTTNTQQQTQPSTKRSSPSKLSKDVAMDMFSKLLQDIEQFYQKMQGIGIGNTEEIVDAMECSSEEKGIRMVLLNDILMAKRKYKASLEKISKDRARKAQVNPGPPAPPKQPPTAVSDVHNLTFSMPSNANQAHTQASGNAGVTQQPQSKNQKLTQSPPIAQQLVSSQEKNQEAAQQQSQTHGGTKKQSSLDPQHPQATPHQPVIATNPNAAAERRPHQPHANLKIQYQVPQQIKEQFKNSPQQFCCSQKLSKNLKKIAQDDGWSSGDITADEEVVQLQNLLNMLWHDAVLIHSQKAATSSESIEIITKHIPLKVDGFFGERTEKCVLKFQKYKELNMNGIVTEHVWALMLNHADHIISNSKKQIQQQELIPPPSKQQLHHHLAHVGGSQRDLKASFPPQPIPFTTTSTFANNQQQKAGWPSSQQQASRQNQPEMKQKWIGSPVKNSLRPPNQGRALGHQEFVDYKYLEKIYHQQAQQQQFSEKPMEDKYHQPTSVGASSQLQEFYMVDGVSQKIPPSHYDYSSSQQTEEYSAAVAGGSSAAANGGHEHNESDYDDEEEAQNNAEEGDEEDDVYYQQQYQQQQ